MASSPRAHEPPPAPPPCDVRRRLDRRSSSGIATRRHWTARCARAPAKTERERQRSRAARKRFDQEFRVHGRRGDDWLPEIRLSAPWGALAAMGLLVVVKALLVTRACLTNRWPTKRPWAMKQVVQPALASAAETG
eukprot:6202692-Pleurochrysis_carterae.AAC.3